MFNLTLTTIILLPLVTLGADFVKGTDISWVPGQESRGVVFRDTSGKQRDILDILKNDYQINTIRLRVFVNPSDDWGNGLCNIVATVGMAKRARDAGMQLVLSLHYSDSWADPGKQNPPEAWKNFTAEQLATAVYTHTKAVMVALSTEGIHPEWVQVGNETNDGMLWPTGKASVNMANYSRFVTAGYNAVKEVSPATQTIVHLSNGFDNSLYRWNIGGLIANGAKFDVIGISAYPEYAPNTGVDDWAAFNNKVYANMGDMVTSFGKPVIISETGLDYRAAEQCRNMIVDMMSKLRSLKNHMGLGVAYWEPQASPGYNRGYNLGAWGANGQPTQALNGFRENVGTPVATSKTSQQHQTVETFYRIDNGITITLPPVYQGAAVALYQTNGRIVYKAVYSKRICARLPAGTYLFNVKYHHSQPCNKLILAK